MIPLNYSFIHKMLISFIYKHRYNVHDFSVELSFNRSNTRHTTSCQHVYSHENNNHNAFSSLIKFSHKNMSHIKLISFMNDLYNISNISIIVIIIIISRASNEFGLALKSFIIIPIAIIITSIGSMSIQAVAKFIISCQCW